MFIFLARVFSTKTLVTLVCLVIPSYVWEKHGCEDDYSFDKDEVQDISTLININLTSTITYMQALLPNLRQAENGKVILIGSTAGLDRNEQCASITLNSIYAVLQMFDMNI